MKAVYCLMPMVMATWIYWLLMAICVMSDTSIFYKPRLYLNDGKGNFSFKSQMQFLLQ